MNHAKSLCAILQGPQKNIYRRTPSISTFTSICIFKKYILGDRTAVICVDVPLGLRKYDSCSQCWSPRSLRDSSVWIPQFLQCLKCGNQTMLVMCVFKRVSCHLCALCSWGTNGDYWRCFRAPIYASTNILTTSYSDSMTPATNVHVGQQWSVPSSCTYFVFGMPFLHVIRFLVLFISYIIYIAALTPTAPLQEDYPKGSHSL